MVLRDENGSFIACSSLTRAGLVCAKEAEALGLLEALRSLRHQKNFFELDAKCVVDAVNNPMHDVSEFGSSCILLLNQENFFTVNFVRRQANETAHVLASLSFASPSVRFHPPDCIFGLLSHDCNGSF